MEPLPIHKCSTIAPHGQAISSETSISNLINKSYNIIFPTIEEKSRALNITSIMVIILGEMHTDESHASNNAVIVDYLWYIHRSNLILLTEDGAHVGHCEGQARFITTDVKTKRWDTECPESLQIAKRKIFLNYIHFAQILIRIHAKFVGYYENKKSLDVVNLKNELYKIIGSIYEESSTYKKIVDETLAIRDRRMQLHIKEERLDSQKRIVIIAGNDHVKQFSTFSAENSFSLLALSQKASLKLPKTSNLPDTLSEEDMMDDKNIYKFLCRQIMLLDHLEDSSTIENYENFLFLSVIAQSYAAICILLE